MPLLLLSLTLFAAAVVMLLLKRGTERARLLPLWAPASVLVLGLLTLVLSMTAIVQAKNVAVLTTFGKPAERTLDPGLHLKAPWQKATELDGTVQTDEYNGDNCIYVRIGDGSQGCVTATIRWRIVPERANTIFGDYRSDDPTESLRDAVVSTQFKAAAQEELAEYNPVADLQVVEGEAAETASLDFAPDYDQIADGITDSMSDRLGEEPLVEIQSISVSYVSLSDTTQDKIDDFIAEVANTRIALQRRQTNAAEALALQELNEALRGNPEVLVSRCLDLLAAMNENAQPIPAGFSCWPGGGSALVLPSTPPEAPRP